MDTGIFVLLEGRFSIQASKFDGVSHMLDVLPGRLAAHFFFSQIPFMGDVRLWLCFNGMQQLYG